MASYSIGELFAALTFAFATNFFPVKYLIGMVLLIAITGSLIYGFAVAGWMVMLGRGLQGVFQGGMSTLMRLYIGESTNIAISLKNEDPTTSQLKNTTYLITFASATTGAAIGPGICMYVHRSEGIETACYYNFIIDMHST